jgi:hypothetical protein
MRRLFSLASRLRLSKKWLVALAVLAGIAWLSRTPLLSWYYLRQLAAAGAEDREAWAERVAGLGDAVLPALLDCLARDDARACANAEAALSRLARSWGAADPRTASLVEELRQRFGGLSGPGREAALELAMVLLHPGEGKASLPAPLVEAGGKLLTAAAACADSGVRVLALADVLAGSAPGRWPEVYRGLIDKGLAADDGECRVRAIHLTMHSALRQQENLLKRVVELLRDQRAEVRRAALLAVGLSEQAISKDDLLPLLHDPDVMVCRLCEAALRQRGLEERHLRLAWLVSAPRAEDRLGVLRHLGYAADLDPGVWLRRLTQDPDAAVRFAAMASAAANRQVDLSDRLREMRDGDPSPTVRQWAPYFLRRKGAVRGD